MKQRHKEHDRAHARAILQGWNVRLDQDYHTLCSEQVELVLADADRYHYRLPKHANGSRARYYYHNVQRRAQ